MQLQNTIFEPSATARIEKNFAAKSKKHSREDFADATFYLYSLVHNQMLSPDAAAKKYIKTYPHIDAEPLRFSNRRQNYKAWRAFNADTQRMFKFFGCVDRPCRYIITAKDLNLPQEFENPALFYDKDVNQAWKDAINQLFNTKNRNNVIWYKLECADKIHAHVIAGHDAALLHLPRGTTKPHKVRLIETPEGAIEYLLKPPMTYTPKNLAIWIQARRDYPAPKHLPQVSAFRNLPNSRTWGKA
jgi:ribosomal 50S subunit-associated protein YjgA (DUF615 family)